MGKGYTYKRNNKIANKQIKYLNFTGNQKMQKKKNATMPFSENLMGNYF